MRSLRSIVSSILVLAVVAVLAPIGSAQTVFEHLRPDRRAWLPETVPVNFVFVGYTRDEVNRDAFLAGLPSVYRPLIRSRLFYGIREPLGLRYTYEHRVTFTSPGFDDAFFEELAALSQPADRTQFQRQYNQQEGNVRTVRRNHFIDAASVEQWLIEHPPSGVDTTKDTVFFINWWGRSDFEYHVYTKTDEPDPDTGYNFGVARESRKIIAWGGTPADDEENGPGARGTHRVWFYDLSAGPESWTDNWNVDDADIDGDGRPDYRMPPIWEYLSRGGFRGASALSGDLSKVARYVAIDLLFTTSPLYPPALTPERLPATVNLDLNTYEAWPGVDVSERFIQPELVRAELSDLDPRVTTLDQQDLALEGKAGGCFRLWLINRRCYKKRPQYEGGFPNLFLYHALHRDRFADGGGQYEAMAFNFGTDFEAGGLLGYADDNWIDGTQSLIFAFVDPVTASEFGYGLSTTLIHETGHHLGLSHPHDGYDFEADRDFGPSGRYYFAWSGDEANSIMSYIDLNWDFSQFDRDNFQRHQAAAYITNANAIAADVLDSGGSAAVADLQRADVRIGAAKHALAAHDYQSTLESARSAYMAVRDAAVVAGVPVRASENGWVVLPPEPEPGSPVARPPYAYRDRIGPNAHRGRG